MFSAIARLLTFCLAGAFLAWWVRLLLHSKVPPPEGRWREITLEDTS